MAVKILGGLLRGLSLEIPAGDKVRPTSILLRRRIFDWRQSMRGHTFVDLYAGSGAMGFESLSRDASEVIFVEEDSAVFRTLKKNFQKSCEQFKDPEIQEILKTKTRLIQTKALNFLKNFGPMEDAVLFIDPPYEKHQEYMNVLELLAPNFKGELWVESDSQKGVSEELISQYLEQSHKTFFQGTNFVFIGKFKNKKI